MKCYHCGEELGNGDEYDLYKSHMSSCNSKVARKAQDSLDQEMYGWL